MNFATRRRIRPTAVCLLLAALLGHVSGCSRQAGESDAQRFVRETRLLESQPLSDPAYTRRMWLWRWVQESPDVLVRVCAVVRDPAGQLDEHEGMLQMQSWFGNAAFQLERPDKKHDQLAMQLAGVESLLRAYESLIDTVPEARTEYRDELLEELRQGSLSARLEPLVEANCTGEIKP